VTQEVRLDVSICFDSNTLPWQPFRPAGLADGLYLHPLRRLESGRLRSAVLNIPAGWNSAKDLRLLARLHFFVISGDLKLGDLTLTENSYVVQPEKSVMPPFGSTNGCEIIVIADGTPAFDDAIGDASGDNALILPNAYDVPYHQPAHDGWKLDGFQHRTIWQDPVTGADTRLLVIPPGFEGRGLNYHPVNEEIFCLSGDIGPDDIRLMKPGWYLWNPAYGVHGWHEHSNGGSTVLEWHDGDWGMTMYEIENN